MKKSALITIWGFILMFIGSIIGYFGLATAAAASRYSDDDGVVSIVIAAVVILAGFIVLLIGVYRALAKIDALPLPLDTVKDQEKKSGSTNHDGGELGEAATSATAPSL